MSSTEKQANTLSATLAWFSEARPEPTSKQIHTQLGVHFEEVAEMIEALQGLTPFTSDLLDDARVALSALASHLKANDQKVEVFSDVLLLDSICDQIVTGVGVAHHAGFAVVEAMDEVNASNFSKFVDGKAIVDANGKIQKGPGYFKPDLKPYI